MKGLHDTVRSISAGFRPTSAQCWSSTSILCRTFSGEPDMFHMSAYFATVRSVLRSPEPPIIKGSLA
jgi:hypothetical protein